MMVYFSFCKIYRGCLKSSLTSLIGFTRLLQEMEKLQILCILVVEFLIFQLPHQVLVDLKKLLIAPLNRL